MHGWQRRIATGLAVGIFGLVSVGASSCDQAKNDLNKAEKDLNKAQKDLNDITGKNNAKYRAGFQQVRLGMSKAEVRAIMGKPRDTQRMESTYGVSEEWYYGSYQLSFEDGKLTSKNKF